MSARPTPENGISINPTGIILGSKVANFFKKRNTNFVNVILNYNNSSMLIIDAEKDFNHGNGNDHRNNGMKISYPGQYPQSKIKYTIIILRQIVRYVNLHMSNVFQARPFNNKSVIIEKLPFFSDSILEGCSLVIKPNEKLIMFGCYEQLRKIKLEDVTKPGDNFKSAQTNETNQENLPIVNKESPQSGKNNIPDDTHYKNLLPEVKEKIRKSYSQIIFGT